MANVPQKLSPRAPFSGFPTVPTTGRGVVVHDRDGIGLATVLARKGQDAALAQRVRDHCGIELPEGPHRKAASDVALIGTGPGTWLATREKGGNSFATSLIEAIGDSASISDQSDGYAVLRLSGPRARDTLCKLIPIDVHPHVFKIGDAASTVASHIGVTLWRLEDDTDGSSVFEIMLFRSFAASFWDALFESAAEFGLVVA